MLRRVYSGIQPSGKMHLGNYFGAVHNWVRIQNQETQQHAPKNTFDLMQSVPILENNETVYNNSRELAATLLGCGIDPSKSVLYKQSDVPAHAELMWILSCFTLTSWVERMTQYKEKIKDGISPSLGLFSYPVLMAADILLFNATHVPVGEDQMQHLELTRKIAETVNLKFKKEVFPIPAAIFTPTPRVMSLTDGKKKMSKSALLERSRIHLFDSEEEIASKIRKAKTDAVQGITFDEQGRPEISNLIKIYSSVAPLTTSEICSKYKDSLHSQFKEDLSTALIKHLIPISTKAREFLNNGYADEVLKKGALQANKIAEHNLRELKTMIGLL